MRITNFSSGELSANLRGRYDLQQYYQGVAKLSNFEVIPTGGIYRRKGTSNCGKLHGDARLIPFIVNRNTSFIFECTPGAIYVWKNGEKMIDITGEQVTLPAPYTSIAQWREVQLAQNYDTLIMVQRDNAPYEIKYDITARNFITGEMEFDFFADVELDDDYNYIDVVEALPPGVDGKYCVYKGKLWKYSGAAQKWEIEGTDPDIDYDLFTKEGKYPGAVAFFNSRLWLASTKQGMQKIWASCAPDTKGNRYNEFTTYKKYVTVNKVIKDPDLHLVTADVRIQDGKTVLYNLSQNLEGKLAKAAAEYYCINEDLLPSGIKVESITATSITLNYVIPSELLDEGAAKRKLFYITLWQSTDGATADDYEYKVVSTNMTTADCSFNFELASDQNDGIAWLAANKYMTAGTEASVWCIPSAVNALNVMAEMNGRYGSDNIQALPVANAIIYFAGGKKGIREYYYSSQEEAFKTNNIAIFAEQMLEESKAVDFDYMNTPYNRLMVTREDGTIASMLYDKTTGVMAWNRIVLGGGGIIRSTAVVNGSSYCDIAYFAVQRGEEFYLEKYDDEAEVYLDAWEPFDIRKEYPDEAIVYNKTRGSFVRYRENAVIEPEFLIDYTDELFIGIEYESYMESLPVLSDDASGKRRIASLLARFNESYLPTVQCVDLPDEEFSAEEEPYSGVLKIAYPGITDRDVTFSIKTSKPYPVKILGIEAQTA